MKFIYEAIVKFRTECVKAVRDAITSDDVKTLKSKADVATGRIHSIDIHKIIFRFSHMNISEEEFNKLFSEAVKKAESKFPEMMVIDNEKWWVEVDKMYEELIKIKS